LETDRASIESETVAVLQRLIQFDTTNPPGNELPLAQWIHGTFTAEGIESQVLVSAPNRGIVIARIRGEGSVRPVMLLAHMDVVGVERDKWSHDPFGGVVEDGYLYGRGAIDDKGMLAANMMAMLVIHRDVVARRLKLGRDILFVATSDEEAGGAAGLQWLVNNRRDLLEAEYAINEGGRTRVLAGGKRYLAIQIAEKVSHMVTITARGPAGHAAVPRDGNAIFTLASALAKLAQYSEPISLTEATRRFFGELAAIWTDDRESTAMRAIAAGADQQIEEAGAVLSANPVFNAVLRNTITPTFLGGGVRGNVIPAEVSVGLNVRTLPGHSIDDIVSRLKRVVAAENVEMTASTGGVDGPASDPDSPMFAALARAAKELDPEMAVVPYLGTGATESAQLRSLGIEAYGLLPFPMVPADEERMHGHDERVPIASLHFGTRLISESVRRVATGAT
jgi:acetylornithine deacetylase/succinyl-diaminopimelate desuccinylase-like protein